MNTLEMCRLPVNLCLQDSQLDTIPWGQLHVYAEWLILPPNNETGWWLTSLTSVPLHRLLWRHTDALGDLYLLFVVSQQCLLHGGLTCTHMIYTFWSQVTSYCIHVILGSSYTIRKVYIHYTVVLVSTATCLTSHSAGCSTHRYIPCKHFKQ